MFWALQEKEEASPASSDDGELIVTLDAGSAKLIFRYF